MTDSQHPKLDILAFGAHPDDVELCAAGTLIKHIRAGYKAGVVDLTRGELGTRGTPELRTKEAEAAGRVMGLTIRENLDMRDGFIEATEENLLKIVRTVRKYRPDIVLANAIRDRHPDHAMASDLESRGCFLAGLRKIQTDINGVPQQPWRPRAIYHYIQDYQLDPDVSVDITDEIDGKMEAIRCFKSQFYDPDSKEPESPISVKDFLDYVLASCKTHGRPIGAEYGEGFTVERTIGVHDLTKLL